MRAELFPISVGAYSKRMNARRAVSTPILARFRANPESRRIEQAFATTACARVFL